MFSSVWGVGAADSGTQADNCEQLTQAMIWPCKSGDDVHEWRDDYHELSTDSRFSICLDCGTEEGLVYLIRFMS